MTAEVATAGLPAVEAMPEIDSPASTGQFRRRVAGLSLAANTAIAAALTYRHGDLGPNAADIISWVAIMNGGAVLGAIGFKAWETLGVLRGRRP